MDKIMGFVMLLRVWCVSRGTWGTVQKMSRKETKALLELSEALMPDRDHCIYHTSQYAIMKIRELFAAAYDEAEIMRAPHCEINVSELTGLLDIAESHQTMSELAATA